MLMAIILIISQYIILAQKSRWYDLLERKAKERDAKIDTIIELLTDKGKDENKYITKV